MLGIFYLVLSIFLFLGALSAVLPRLLGQTAASVTAPLALLIQLFLPHVVAFYLLGTLVVGAVGGYSGLPGQIGLLLQLLSLLLIGHDRLRMRRAYPRLDGKTVLDEGPVCEAWKTQSPPLRISLLPALGPGKQLRSSVEVLRDICYREVAGVRLCLDVYRLRQATRSQDDARPSILYMHGGSWTSGNRRQSPYLAYELAAAGYVVFAIDYRLAPRHPLPAALHDCKAAAAWVKEHAPEYAGGSSVVAIGGSAGGHFAAMLALTANQPRFQPGFEKQDTTVLAAIPLYGIFDIVSNMKRDRTGFTRVLFEKFVIQKRYADRPELFHDLEPSRHAHKDAPPMLIMHGESDSLAPIDDSRRLAKRLRELSAPVHLVEIPHAQHGFEMTRSPHQQRAQRIIQQFLESL